MEEKNQIFSSKEENSSHFLSRIFWFFLLLFCLKAIYFALNIREKVFPDEATWFGICEVFSRVFFLPGDSPESYPLALVTHIPNLYFFLMGKLLVINPFLGHDLIVLRLANVAVSMTTVFFAWRLSRLLLDENGSRLLFFVMLTNTMMFTFIAGAVNYDNLSTLFAVLSLYYLTLFLQHHKVGFLLSTLLFLLAGMLTKNVFLPYAGGLIIVLIIGGRLTFFTFSGLRSLGFTFFSRWDFGKFLGVLVLLAINLNLYLGNIINYSHLIPGMDQVIPIESCLQNRLFARGYVVNQYKNNKLSMLEAQRLVLQIRDPGDRAAALGMLERARYEKAVKPVRVNRLAYTIEWGRIVTARLYGVAAHLALYKSERLMVGYYLVLGLGFILFIWRFIRDDSTALGGVLFVFLFYTIILMQVVNYNNYRGVGLVGIALTGRYLFPVIVPLYLLIAHGLVSKTPRWWKWGGGIIVSIFFIWGDFPWFIQNATANWYGG